jgi:hypothetical protein
MDGNKKQGSTSPKSRRSGRESRDDDEPGEDGADQDYDRRPAPRLGVPGTPGSPAAAASHPPPIQSRRIPPWPRSIRRKSHRRESKNNRSARGERRTKTTTTRRIEEAARRHEPDVWRCRRRRSFRAVHGRGTQSRQPQRRLTLRRVLGDARGGQVDPNGALRGRRLGGGGRQQFSRRPGR